MKKNVNISVNIKEFWHWAGGLDFLKTQINSLLKLKSANPLINLYLLVPVPTLRQRFITYASRVKRLLLSILRKSRKNSLMPLSPQGVKYFFNDPNIEIVTYTNTEEGLRKALKRINTSVLYLIPTYCEVDCATVGYIPDLQHKHLPHLFSPKEITARDVVFSTLLQGVNKLVVNSTHTKMDIERHYCPDRNKVYSFPFAPFNLHKLSYGLKEVEKYSLPRRYFLIANQFWVHKDHKTAIRAFAKLKSWYKEDIGLVCTGQTSDYRQPGYFQSIRNLVKELHLTKDVLFLGHIPKDEMNAIMQKCVAVIQPTLFEGGPGGGASFEAVANGVPVILSDIPINREVNGVNILFFKAGDADDLCQKAKVLLESKIEYPQPADLLKKRDENEELHSRFVWEVIESAIEDYTRKEKGTS